MDLVCLVSEWFLGLPPTPLSTLLLQRVLLTRDTPSPMMRASYKDGHRWRERKRKPPRHTFSLNSIQSTQTAAEMG